MSRNFRGFFIGALSLLGAISFSSCGPSSGSASRAKLELVEVQNGFGLMLPHRVRLVTDDPSTAPVVKILSMQDLKANVSSTNPILPVQHWPEDAILPSGLAGNHFIAIQFSADLDMDSILTGTPGSPDYGLAGAIEINKIDMTTPEAPEITPVPGRAFINGYTGIGGSLVKVVGVASGQPVALSATGTGFPGTGTGNNFSGASALVSPKVFVFVADSNSNLGGTPETFPTGVEIQIKITRDVLGANGKLLTAGGLVCSTVGPDTIKPEVYIDTTRTIDPDRDIIDITPGNDDVDVDPSTTIEVGFTEPVQPFFVGGFFQSNVPPGTSPSLILTSGPQNQPTTINFPFSVEPVSVFDLSRYKLTPSLNLPAASPVAIPGGAVFNFAQVEVLQNSFGDLMVVAGTGETGVNALGQNKNTLRQTTRFEIGEGPGLVNAPVAPEAIYIGRNGPEGGISVIDMNGFGQGTGDPSNDLDQLLEPGDVSKWPFNPNFALNGPNGEIVPQMGSPTSTLDGGSAGVFTLTKDTSLSDRLFTAVGNITDIHVGQALDKIFNNQTSATGGACLSGGNNCARRSFMIANGTNSNSIQLGPNPNPPRLLFDPTKNCLSPQILGDDPFSATSTVANGLVVGNAFGTVGGTAPRGLLGGGSRGVSGFRGPAPSQNTPGACASANFTSRQQIGHFLYVVDNSNKKLLVLNSNRMTLIDSISLPDPTRLGFSPDLKVIGVTNFSTGTVSFIGADPEGSSFHQVIAEVAVGEGPMGIAWNPEMEDIFVCNNLGNSVSVLRHGGTYPVRKTVSSQIVSPIDVVVGHRQIGYGDNSALYYAYILNGNGTVTIFESGPDIGAQAIGFDQTIGVVNQSFPSARAFLAGFGPITDVYIAHSNPAGGAQISQVTMISGPTGQQTLNPFSAGQTNFLSPSFRDKQFGTLTSIPNTELSGQHPTDLAFDDMTNAGNIASSVSIYTPFLQGATQDGKDLYRGTGRVSTPSYLFVANPDAGYVDVIDVATMTRFRPVSGGQQQFDGTIRAPGCSVLANYWRQ